ncbi:BON domain-containing protein [Symmachiella macrocystis]|uniref:BON domain-containing protein n=1 Tax=Symmachiella macrocystis TaxID=2527985 RepID=UPI0036F1ECE3
MTSTTTGLRPPPDESARINKPLPPRSATSLYYPRLVIRFDVPHRQRAEPTVIAYRLEESDSFRQLGEIEVVVSGPTATLRGEVASESDRRLAALLATFEPGIDHVQNDLTVNTELKLPPLPPEPGTEADAPPLAPPAAN